MEKVLTIVFCILVFPMYCTAQECIAPSRRTDELTRAEGNQLINLREKHSRKSLKGLIEDVNGNAISALVEVFGVDSTSDTGRTGSGVRIIACEVAGNGIFGVTGLKKGEYELRVSAETGFNMMHIYVKLDPRGGKRRDLIVTVEPAN
jgi:hypothetical protein